MMFLSFAIAKLEIISTSGSADMLILTVENMLPHKVKCRRLNICLIFIFGIVLLSLKLAKLLLHPVLVRHRDIR